MGTKNNRRERSPSHLSSNSETDTDIHTHIPHIVSRCEKDVFEREIVSRGQISVRALRVLWEVVTVEEEILVVVGEGGETDGYRCDYVQVVVGEKVRNKHTRLVLLLLCCFVEVKVSRDEGMTDEICLMMKAWRSRMGKLWMGRCFFEGWRFCVVFLAHQPKILPLASLIFYGADFRRCEEPNHH